MAFAINRPGHDFDETKFEDWIRGVNGGVMPALGAMSALRRLHFETIFYCYYDFHGFNRTTFGSVCD